MFRSPFSDVEVPDVSLSEFVLARAGEFGEKPALIDAPSGRTLTYVQLLAGVRAVASALARRGFGKGDVLAHYAPTCRSIPSRFSRWRRSGAQHDRQSA